MTHLDARPDPRPVFIGTRQEAVAMLRAARAAGRLVSYTQPVPAPGAPGRVMLRVQLADHPTPPARPATPAPTPQRWVPQPRPRLPPAAWAAIAVAALAILGAAIWVIVTLLAWVLAHLALITATLAAAVLIVVLLSRAGICPGIHCPGCPHHR